MISRACGNDVAVASFAEVFQEKGDHDTKEKGRKEELSSRKSEWGVNDTRGLGGVAQMVLLLNIMERTVSHFGIVREQEGSRKNFFD